MKKIISIALTLALLLLSFSGCSIFKPRDPNEGKEPNENLDNGENAGCAVDKSSDLIRSIVAFLGENVSVEDMPNTDLTYTIDLIKENGVELLEVEFDILDYYFVCGYDSDSSESRDAARAEKCNWITFDSSDKIPEYYNNEKCVFVFQLNRSSSVISYFGSEKAPDVEHFSEYEPEFKQGYNVAPPIPFDEDVIYINGALSAPVAEGTVYYTTKSSLSPWTTLPFIENAGAKVLMLEQDADKNEAIGLELVLGDYYDEFAEFGRIDKCELYLSDGSTFAYSLIVFSDFIEVIKNEGVTSNVISSSPDSKYAPKEVSGFKGTLIDNDSEVIKAIVKYLYDKSVDHDMIDLGLPDRVDKLRNGKAELLDVTFDPFEKYFLCGYYSDASNKSMSKKHLIAKECTWFRFDSPDEIPEYYNGEKCIFSFQFNGASSVTNVLKADVAPEIHHFLEYKTKFEQGYNTAPPIVFYENILLLYNTANPKDIGYYSTSTVFHRMLTIAFIEIDNEKYITINRYLSTSNGKVRTLESHLWKYYEDFIRVTNITEYETYFPDSTTFIMSVISLDDFIEIVETATEE